MLAGSIHHAAIVVSDLERSLEVYRDILGLKVLFNDTLSIKNMPEFMGLPSVEGQTFMLQQAKGNVTGMVELIEMTDPKPVPSLKGQGFKTTGLRMLSFRVKDIDRVYELLLEKNCTFLSPPKHLKWDKYSVKACCFLDPDDVLIEIMEFLPLTES